MTYAEKHIIKALSNIFKWDADKIDLIKSGNPHTWTATCDGHRITFESEFGIVLQNIRRA